MSFETTADLDLVVSDQALRQVRGEIESGLGAIEIGTTDGGTMSAQAGRSSGGSRQRRQSLRMDRTQTEHLEDISLYLESIDDVLSEGGLLGGGGLGGVGTELLGVGAETAGDVAVETGNTVADAVIDTVTTGVGNVIADVVPGGGGGGGGGGGSGRGGDTLSPTITTDTELSPTFSPVFRPTLNPEFSPQFSPEFTPELDVAPRVDVSPQVDVSPRVDVSPELEVDFPDLNFGSDIQSPHPVEVTNWPTVPAGSGEADRQPNNSSDATGGVQVGGDNGITLGPGGIQFGGDNGITLGTDPGDPTRTQSDIGQNQTATVTNSFDVSPQFTFNIDTDRLVREVSREFDKKIRDIKSELIDRVEDVEGDLDDLKRDIRR